MKAIINGRIVTKNSVIENGQILFDDKIIAVGDNLKTDGIQIYDAKGKYVIPGLVDIHIHGFVGYDVSDTNEESINRMSEALTKNGVTSWCPTTMTVSKTDIMKQLDIMRKLKNHTKGAKILGANVEGPFINPNKKGAQAEKYIIAPDSDMILRYSDIIKLVTIAPEMGYGMDFIEDVTKNSNITVSIGHTDADYMCASEAIKKGARNITHLFNAMPPFHHRDVGVIGAAFENECVSCEIIADTFHINPALYRMLAKIKGDKLILITDCMSAGGMKDGEYTLGGQKVMVNGIECRLKDGTIAGSILTLNKAVYNFIKHSQVPVWQAVNMASLYPAEVVGEGDRIGSIEVGKCADFAIADDEMNITQTIVNGILV